MDMTVWIDKKEIETVRETKPKEPMYGNMSSENEMCLSIQELVKHLENGRLVNFGRNAICIEMDNVYASSFGDWAVNPCYPRYTDKEIETIEQERFTLNEYKLDETLALLKEADIEPCIAYHSFSSSEKREKFHIIIALEPVDVAHYPAKSVEPYDWSWPEQVFPRETDDEWHMLKDELSCAFGYSYDRGNNLYSGTVLFGTNKGMHYVNAAAPVYSREGLREKLEHLNQILDERDPDRTEKMLSHFMSHGGGDGAYLGATTKLLTERMAPNGDLLLPSSSAIGDFTFARRENLRSVTIPDSVTSIGEYAFEDCANLTSVAIPNSVTSIGTGAFRNCNKLESVTIPESVTNIGEYAFDLCVNLTSVVIPDGVTSIGTGAFEFCKNVKSVTIPNSVTSIGDSAFSGCDSLASVAIPDSVTSIEQYTFSSCENLRSVTISESVTNIGYRAFGGCKNLTSVTIPDSVTNIDRNAFSDCPATIICGQDSYAAQYARENKIAVEYIKAEPKNVIDEEWVKENYHGEVEFTIPDSVTSIGEAAFAKCMRLTSATISNGVTEIEKQAFAECINLISVNIPDSVTKIEEGAFIDCNLFFVKIPNGVTSIEAKTFEGCNHLTSVKIPDSVTSIGTDAFASCRDLRFVTIPDSVTSIEDSAFDNCTNLRSVTIPDSVTNIGNRAFAHCSSLRAIYIPDSVTRIESDAFLDCPVTIICEPDSYAAQYAHEHNIATCSEAKFEKREDSTATNRFDKKLTETWVDENYHGEEEFAIPDGITEIEEKAFANCGNLTSVKIPDSVTKIGFDAFFCCRDLESVTIPNGVTEIDDQAFAGCTNLTSVDIPDSVTKIGIQAFGGCDLTSVTIPDSVISIEGGAFEDCVNLTSVTIPNSVKSIGEWAFLNCPATIICEPNSYAAQYARENKISVEYIEAEPEKREEQTATKNFVVNGDWVRENYHGEAEFTIPDGAAKIEERAFEGCDSLTSVIIPDSVTSIGNHAFEECSSLKSVHIPDSVTSIGFCAFSSCENLASVTIPESVTSIENGAFSYCGLKSVIIPDSVTRIGEYAFMQCNSLTSVTISNSVTSIKDCTFEACRNLRSVTIPDSVTSIGDYAFTRCKNLKSITIPDSVTSIGDHAFEDCVTVIREPNSYAEKHARENKFTEVESEKNEQSAQEAISSPVHQTVNTDFNTAINALKETVLAQQETINALMAHITKIQNEVFYQPSEDEKHPTKRNDEMDR